MTKNSPEKTFIKKIFKHKEPKELTTANDIEQVVLQQHKSAKQIKKLTDDIQHNQHKAAVGTSDLVSQLKHLKNRKETTKTHTAIHKTTTGRP